MSDCKTVRLGDVATYINGYAFKPSDWGTEGLPIIRIQNLTGNDYETNFYNGKIPEKYFVKNGDVLISWSASLGVYEWKKNDALLNQHIFKVVFDKLEVDKKYFMFTVSNLLNAMSKQTHGSTMRHITKPDFDNMPFPLPPIEKQKQIARKLDKCNELILKNNRILEKYDLLIKSRFIEMIGDPSKNNKKWEIKKLGDIIRVLGGYAFSSKAFKDSGIPVLRIGNINSGVFRPTNMVFWDDDEKIERYAIYPGDLVMSLTGTVGKDDYGNVCILGNDYPKYYLNQRNAKLEIISDLERFYLSYLLKFPEIKSRLTNISRGIRQANIANKDIENLQIPVPPIELQKDFTVFVQQIDKSKFAVQKSLEKAETLYKSLMQEYFG